LNYGPTVKKNKDLSKNEDFFQNALFIELSSIEDKLGGFFLPNTVLKNQAKADIVCYISGNKKDYKHSIISVIFELGKTGNMTNKPYQAICYAAEALSLTDHPNPAFLSNLFNII
jgi:hypothetical protein